MKIAVTFNDVESIESFAKNGADIFILGNDDFASRLTSSQDLEYIPEIIQKIKSLGKEVYISLNMIMHNKDVESVKVFLETLKKVDIDGIIFGDLGVYMLARRLNLHGKLIYNPETLATNSYDPLFWKSKGIKGITISKEITLKEVLETAKNSNIEISFIGHGHLNMFHSRRPLIENFLKYQEDQYEDKINNKNLKLVEEIRNEEYPIYQDIHGTHIFREKALESFKEILDMKDTIDVFIIDGIFKTDEYLLQTLAIYNEILTSTNKDNIAQKYSEIYQEDHDSGFLFKKTVYDKY